VPAHDARVARAGPGGAADAGERAQGRQPRRFRRTIDSQHTFPVAPNRLDQDFTAAAPDEKWGADLS